MRIKIDYYRGWDIYFDTYDSKFSSYSNVNDLEFTKTSYSAIKKAIDDFIVQNSEFKPFYIENITPGLSKEKLKVIGIRKDGRFVYENGSGEKNQLSEYDEKKYMIFVPSNKEVFDKYNEMMAEVDRLKKLATKYVDDNLKIKKLVDYKNEFYT